jgi:hypothetical protein
MLKPKSHDTEGEKSEKCKGQKQESSCKVSPESLKEDQHDSIFLSSKKRSLDAFQLTAT